MTRWYPQVSDCMHVCTRGCLGVTRHVILETKIVAQRFNLASVLLCSLEPIRLLAMFGHSLLELLIHRKRKKCRVFCEHSGPLIHMISLRSPALFLPFAESYKSHNKGTYRNSQVDYGANKVLARLEVWRRL